MAQTSEKDRKILTELATKVMGTSAREPLPLEGGGSERSFFRLEGAAPELAENTNRDTGEAPERPHSVIGVVGRNAAENRALLGFSRHFSEQGLPVPRIYAADETHGMYIMEDLGDTTLADQLARWRQSPNGKAHAMSALSQVVGWLPRFQIHGGEGLDYGLCYEGREMNGFVFEADIERFLMVYVYRHTPSLKPSERVLNEMDELVARLEAVPRQHFCYRDFQARNIMWTDGPVFLDFQSGRLGALQYDLASFLYSPDTGLDEHDRAQLIGVYLDALSQTGEQVSQVEFLANFHMFVLVRRLQALGAYAHLSKTRSPQYLEKIPPALADLKHLQETQKLTLALPALEAWLVDLFNTQPIFNK